MQEIIFLLLVYVLPPCKGARKYIIKLNMTWFENKGIVFVINLCIKE
jgi:hypothetical protein